MSFFQGAELTRLLHDYGYGLVGLLVCLEAIGLPLPGESLVIAAALYAGSTHGMNIAAVVAVTAVGAILGSGIGYAIGRSFGFRVLRRYGHYVGLTEERLKIGRYLFERHGGKVVLLGRFVAFLRNLAALLAGVTQMEWRRFMLANAAGAILWAGLYGFGAYFSRQGSGAAGRAGRDRRRPHRRGGGRDRDRVRASSGAQARRAGRARIQRSTSGLITLSRSACRPARSGCSRAVTTAMPATDFVVTPAMCGEAITVSSATACC